MLRIAKKNERECFIKCKTRGAVSCFRFAKAQTMRLLYGLKSVQTLNSAINRQKKSLSNI